jgi:hydroxymethylpyrimidine/phosphomethylpyrimidine kinase
MSENYPRILTIAGSDSSGGAGIQADLKTFQALGSYGMSAIVALTAQNTLGVRGILPVPAEFVKKQLVTVLEDPGVECIKVGMLLNIEIIEAVSAVLGTMAIDIPIVLDPVMIAKSGDRLLEDNAIEALVKQLFPRSLILTPNIPEAITLSGLQILSEYDMQRAAQEICNLGPAYVLLKGGHLGGDFASDYLYSRKECAGYWFREKRIVSKAGHGTGCTLSAAIAAYLGKGEAVQEAVKKAKIYLSGAMQRGAAQKIGQGSHPLVH